jgi:hypothetical protein
MWRYHPTTRSEAPFSANLVQWVLNEAASGQAGPRYDASDRRPMCRPEHPPKTLSPLLTESLGNKGFG